MQAGHHHDIHQPLERFPSVAKSEGHDSEPVHASWTDERCLFTVVIRYLDLVVGGLKANELNRSS